MSNPTTLNAVLLIPVVVLLQVGYDRMVSLTHSQIVALKMTYIQDSGSPRLYTFDTLAFGSAAYSSTHANIDFSDIAWDRTRVHSLEDYQVLHCTLHTR